MMIGDRSVAERLAALPPDRRIGWSAGLSGRAIRRLESNWAVWARPAQLPPPGDWRVWLMMAGRGFGKTRAGAEWVRGLAEASPATRIALIAAILGKDAG